MGFGVLIMSTVRENLLTKLGYSPYCGADVCRGRYPRTEFNGKQFECPSCRWKSKFELEFIEEYKIAQGKLAHEISPYGNYNALLT